MKRLIMVIGLTGIGSGSLLAQTAELQVQGTSPRLFLLHSVQPKENWYSVGRLFNASPKEMAPYNGLTLDKPLAIGQQLKIPLAADNFSQDGQKAADEVLVPVYHTLQEKEWLYRVSVNYNKVPIESLEKWNNIKKEQARPGMTLVIGYLKVKPALSALAAQAKSRVPVTATVTKNAENPAGESGKNEPLAAKKTETVKEKPLPSNEKTEENRIASIKNDPPRQDNKEIKTETRPETKTELPIPASVDHKGGYFKSAFDDTGKAASGLAGIFKSTSGWNDGKYYLLLNSAPIGTIVRVTNPVNGRAVFAKVLGSMPDMKENTGLTIRISDAAAAELGSSNTRFGVEIKY